MLTRIVIGKTVYLFINEVCDILNITKRSFKKLVDKNKITIGPGKTLLISEKDYNEVLLSHPDLFKRNGSHEEITTVDTLRVRVEDNKRLLPLKKVFFRNLNDADEMRKCIVEAKKILQNKTDKTKWYKQSLSVLNNKNFFDLDILQKYGLAIQSYTEINTDTGSVSLNAFIVGNGVFYSLFLDEGMEDNWLSLKETQTGELEIEKLNSSYQTEKYIIKRNNCNRDFRKYSVFDNIVWCIKNLILVNDWQNEINCNQDGIYFNFGLQLIIKLINENSFKNIQVFEGIIKL